MKKKSTEVNPSASMGNAKPEAANRQAAPHKAYQFTKFQDHSHGRQCKSPFSVNHEPGIY